MSHYFVILAILKSHYYLQLWLELFQSNYQKKIYFCITYFYFELCGLSAMNCLTFHSSLNKATCFKVTDQAIYPNFLWCSLMSYFFNILFPTFCVSLSPPIRIYSCLCCFLSTSSIILISFIASKIMTYKSMS